MQTSFSSTSGAAFLIAVTQSTLSLGFAQCPEVSLHAEGAEFGDEFGNSIDVEGTTLLVGAPARDHGGIDQART